MPIPAMEITKRLFAALNAEHARQRRVPNASASAAHEARPHGLRAHPSDSAHQRNDEPGVDREPS